MRNLDWLWGFLFWGGVFAVVAFFVFVEGDDNADEPTSQVASSTTTSSSTTSTNQPSISRSSTSAGQQRTSTNQTTLIDRISCDEIRGTPYRSQTERSFFLSNCTHRENCGAITGTQYVNPEERKWYLANCTGSSTAPSQPSLSHPFPGVELWYASVCWSGYALVDEDGDALCVTSDVDHLVASYGVSANATCAYGYELVNSSGWVLCQPNYYYGGTPNYSYDVPPTYKWQSDSDYDARDYANDTYGFDSNGGGNNNSGNGYSYDYYGGGDLDCAGGSGDNPVVNGPIWVGDNDPHGLDGDGDGWGCE